MNGAERSREQVKNAFGTYETEALKYFQNFRMPGIDMEEMMTNYRKNMDALSEANQMAVETARTITQLQNQYAKQLMENMANCTRQMMTTGTNPQDKFDVQAKSMQRCMKQAVECGQELSKAMNKSSEKMMKLMCNCVDECTTTAKKATKAATAKK